MALAMITRGDPCTTTGICKYLGATEKVLILHVWLEAQRKHPCYLKLLARLSFDVR